MRFNFFATNKEKGIRVVEFDGIPEEKLTIQEG